MASYVTAMTRIFLLSLILVQLTLAAERKVWFGTGADGIYLSVLDDEKGTLSEPKRVAEVGSPGFVVLRKGGGHLYSTARGERGEPGKVFGFEVKEDGSLVEIAQQSSGGGGPCHVDLTPDGKTLLVANYSGGNVASYLVKDDGTFGRAVSVQQHEGSSVHPKRQQRPHAHGFFAGPQGKFAYAPDLGIDKVVRYRVDSEEGKVTKLDTWTMDPGAGPRHLKVGPKGKFIYALGELNLTVTVGELGGEKGPETRQVISVLPEDADKSDLSCSEIRVHPNGKHLYTATRDLRDEGRARLTVFAIGDDGKLERAQVIAAGCAIPRNFALDPTGRWLLVAGQNSDTVVIFKVKEDGQLEATGRTVTVPRPMCVVYAEK